MKGYVARKGPRWYAVTYEPRLTTALRGVVDGSSSRPASR